MSDGVVRQSINVGDIPFSKNIDVATNELFLRSTINRNTERLLSNDLYLYDFVVRFKNSSDYTMLPWRDNVSYKVGDVVIYTEYDRDKVEILNLYILQNMVDGNVAEPKKKIVDGYIADFNDSGWVNLNPFLALYYSEDSGYSLSNYISGVISNKFEISHELNLDYHRFGDLSESPLSSKILDVRASNIADERDCGYWPYVVESLSTDAYVGTMKKWGMGVVEYDLTCKLIGSKQITKIGEDGEVETVGYLAANTLIPVSSEWNDSYFMSREDYTVFAKQGDSAIVEADGVYQTNLLSTVNVYHGKIHFPIPFIDLNYMMFCNSASKNGYINSPAALTFVDKTTSSIVMAYAIPNYNARPMREAMLKYNEFQVQIVGRWR